MPSPSPAATHPPDDVIEPGDGGDPAESQPCQLGSEAAIRSLIFRDGEAYAPTCEEHDAHLRGMLEDAGEKVTDVVEIPTEPVTAAAEAPEIVGPEQDGEIPLRFPVLVLEGVETSDGRFLEAGSLTHRALPIPLLALPESAHGGNEPGAAGVVGRIDTLTRTPGPEVISPRTGEPFPEGTFVWSGTGALSSTARVGPYDVADMFRRRFLRGVSVDLAGMDYEVVGEEGGLAADPEFPRRQMIAHSADIAAATLVVVAAFGDAYAEDATDPATAAPATLDDLPEGLAASAFPAWRSAEVGDYPTLVASAPRSDRVSIPDDAALQLAEFIEGGEGEPRDAQALAAAIVDYIGQTWQLTDDEEGAPADAPAEEGGSMAAADTPLADEPAPTSDDLPTETGMPDEPQPCALGGGEPATHSLLFADGEQYIATCQEHAADARAAIEAEGGEVTGEVPIAAVSEEETP